MNTVHFTCQHCGKDFSYPKYELSAHLGKRVQMKCKQCGGRNKAQITLALLKGEQESKTELFQGETKDRALDISKLVVQNEPMAKDSELQLPFGKTILGRKTDNAPDNKVVISNDDKTVSRNHCQIEKLKEANQVLFTIKDLQSANGTFINDEPLQKEDEVYLMPGDIITIGNVTIKVI